MLISVECAQKLIAQLPVLELELPLDQTLGLNLSEELIADRDFPPFDRVAMDGIAICFEVGVGRWKLTGIQKAGDFSQNLSCKETCIEVMTGSVLPNGCDTVIPWELLEIQGDEYRLKDYSDIMKFQNIHFKGADTKKGEILVSKGVVVNPYVINCAASIGKNFLRVFGPQKVAIVSTGNELVDVEKQPLDHQVRKSNVYSIGAAIRKAFSCEINYFHFLDDEVDIRYQLNRILDEYSLVILSGGVSKGKFDLLPEILQELNVEILFHGISQKPGKPFLAGVKNKVPVFALPGNPSSSIICFYRYVFPYLRKTDFNTKYVQLKTFKKSKDEKTLFCPVIKKQNSFECLETNGSGDMISSLTSVGFIEVPPKGSIQKFFKFYPWYDGDII